MIILHDFLLSSASYRVRIALEMKGLAYESRSYSLRAGEQRNSDYLRLNPAGLVPAIELEGRVITQSLAIIDYLDGRFPDPPLVPQRGDDRARVLEFALTVACDIHPLNNLRVLRYLDERLHQNQAAVQSWYAEWVSLGFETLEVFLRDRLTGAFFLGERPGLAEICLVPQLYNARRYKVPLDDYPQVVALGDRAAQLPAFLAAAKGMPPV